MPWYLKAQLSCSQGEKLSNSDENFQTWQKECQEVPPGFLNPAQTCQAKVIDHFNTHTEQKLTKTCHILQEKKLGTSVCLLDVSSSTFCIAKLWMSLLTAFEKSDAYH